VQTDAKRITGTKDEEDSDLHADISVDGQKISFAEEDTEVIKKKER
jgi:hypothetical protein